jgi:RecA-family ATPase
VNKKPERKAVVIWGNEVEKEIAEFLVPKRIPRGTTSLIAGLPGEGKSMWLCEIAACITRGQFDDPPARVLVTSTEDNINTTLAPRLEAAGAVMSNIGFVSIKVEDDDAGELRFPEDVEAFRAIVEENDFRLALIDPLLGHLTVNSFKDEELRAAFFTPMRRIAEDNDCAIVGVMHLNKRTEGSELARISGSMGGITGPVRSIVMLHRSPDEEHQRVLTHIKSNLGPEGQSLLYELEQVPLEIKGQSVSVGHLKWIGDSPYTAEELLAGQKETPAKVSEAIEFLQAELADGPKSSKELRATAKEQGISYHALNGAQKKLGIVPHKDGFEGG